MTTDHQNDLSLTRRIWLLLVLCAAVSMVMVSFTAFFPAATDIARDTGASQTQITWMIDVYTLTMAALLLPAGAIGDRYGRRGVMNIGMVLFLVGATLALFAQDANQLIAVRAFQGVAAALVMPSTLSLITTLFPARHRPQAVAIWSAVMMVSGAIGVIGVGGLLEFFSWESVLWMTLIFAIASFALGFTIPTTKDDESPRFDVPGATASVIVCGAVVYGTIQGGETGWTSAPVLTAFGIAVAAAVAFVLVELRSREPLLDVRVFAVRPFAVGTLVVGVSFGATYGVFYLGLLHFQYVLGTSALEAALLVGATLAIGLVPATLVANRITDRLGMRMVFLLGVLVDAAAFFALTTADVDTNKYVVATFLVVMGLGIGVTMAPASTAILDHVPEHKHGVASAVNHASREVGTAFAIALFGSLLTARYVEEIGPATQPLPEPAREASRESVAGALAVAEQSGPAGAPLADAARLAFVAGMQEAFLVVGIGLAVFALVLAVWTPGRPRPLPRVELPTGAPTYLPGRVREAADAVRTRIGDLVGAGPRGPGRSGRP